MTPASQPSKKLCHAPILRVTTYSSGASATHAKSESEKEGNETSMSRPEDAASVACQTLLSGPSRILNFGKDFEINVSPGLCVLGLALVKFPREGV